MAVNDFWRRLSGELTEVEQSLHIAPLLLETALLDIATGDAGGITTAQTRTFFGLATGTSAGDEFTDLLTSLGTLSGTAGIGGTKLAAQERALNRIIRFAVVGVRQGKIASNPYDTGNKLRLRAKGLITAFGGTPQGSLAAP